MTERHVRQVRLPEIGEEGQRRLAGGRVAIVGVGATGSHLAASLARAGVGTLRLIDRDVVETSNLPRQTLFTARDADEVRPKVEAAAEALATIDPALSIEPHAADLTADAAPALLGGVDVVLDGTDNVATRLLVNDLCVRDGLPFVYSGVVGTVGQTLVVVPGGPCLRCYVPDVPPPGALPTCETAGVLGTAVALVAALAATEAIKLLLRRDDVRAGVVVDVDVWTGRVRRIALPRAEDCPCCVGRRFPFLEAAPAAAATVLCGRDAVQLPSHGTPVDLARLAGQLAPLGKVHRGALLVRLDTDERRVLVFADGRVIVGGTSDAAEARTIRARLLGD